LIGILSTMGIVLVLKLLIGTTVFFSILRKSIFCFEAKIYLSTPANFDHTTLSAQTIAVSCQFSSTVPMSVMISASFCDAL